MKRAQPIDRSLFLARACMLWSAGSLASWQTDGVPICTSELDQQGARVVSDGLGGAIIAFQHIAFKLADMAMEINAARYLVWHAAWLFDNEKKASKESAFAKCYASDIAMKVTVDAVRSSAGMAT